MTPQKPHSRLVAGVLGGALVTSALAFTTPAATAAPDAPGAKVLVLNDPAYVDTAPLDEVGPEDNVGAEGANMILALQADGHTVSTLLGTDAATIAAALATTDTFLIPELERESWVPQLEGPARAAITSWVRSGGNLVVASDYADTLNDLFGYELETTGDVGWSRTAPAGSPFRDGAETLPDNNGSDAFTLDSLPTGAVSHYTSAPLEGGASAGVVTFPQGKGNVVSLAWDWYDAAPVGLQDEGWNDILDTSVRLGLIKPLPPKVVPPKAAPSNVFSLPAKGKANRANATVTLSLKVPGPGRVKLVSARKGVLKSVSKGVGRTGGVKVMLKPTKRTMKQLRLRLKDKNRAAMKVRVKVTYTPTNGTARTVTKTYVLKVVKKSKRSKK